MMLSVSINIGLSPDTGLGCGLWYRLELPGVDGAGEWVGVICWGEARSCGEAGIGDCGIGEGAIGDCVISISIGLLKLPAA